MLSLSSSQEIQQCSPSTTTVTTTVSGTPVTMTSSVTKTSTVTDTKTTVVTESGQPVTKTIEAVSTFTEVVPTVITTTKGGTTATLTTTVTEPGPTVTQIESGSPEFITTTQTVPTTVNGVATTVTQTVVKPAGTTTAVATVTETLPGGTGGSSTGELSKRCVDTIVGITVPLGIIIPLAVLSQMRIPGLEALQWQFNQQLAEANSRIQQGLGIYQDDVARMSAEWNARLAQIPPQLQQAGGVLATIATLAALTGIIVEACVPTTSNGTATTVATPTTVRAMASSRI